jgi:ABC-type sugar transport system ATPase subunit
MEETPILQVKGASKAYSGVTVLDSVDIDLYQGEVHALVGENGAGKSTLSKIISGVISRDEGKLYKNGKEINPASTKEAVENGISIVHQEFNLIPVLSIAKNIYLGKESVKGKIMIDEAASVEGTRKLLELLDINVSPNTKVSQLSIAQQQLVEIAKCLSYESDIIIMDEPTATLTLNETKNLFRIIKMLQEKKVSIIYISHKMDEIFAVAQRITVLRDGKKIGTYKKEEMDYKKLITLMVGREITNMYQRDHQVNGEVLLKIENLTKRGMVKNISFELRRGEILGFAGLVGAGRTELMKLIFGEYSYERGTVTLFGEVMPKGNIRLMVKNKLAYLPENRKDEGIISGMSIRENITIPVMDKVLVNGVISRNKEKTIARGIIEKLRIRCMSQKQQVERLSGGNQQKVVLGKWLAADVDILILDEPTRGIDVGAKNEIYKLINELCAEGVSIIVISSEMPELIGICDRVIVMSEGKITGELEKDEITEEAIMQAAIQRGYNLYGENESNEQ